MSRPVKRARAQVTHVVVAALENIHDGAVCVLHDDDTLTEMPQKQMSAAVKDALVNGHPREWEAQIAVAVCRDGVLHGLAYMKPETVSRMWATCEDADTVSAIVAAVRTFFSEIAVIYLQIPAAAHGLLATWSVVHDDPALLQFNMRPIDDVYVYVFHDAAIQDIADAVPVETHNFNGVTAPAAWTDDFGHALASQLELDTYGKLCSRASPTRTSLRVSMSTRNDVLVLVVDHVLDAIGYCMCDVLKRDGVALVNRLCVGKPTDAHASPYHNGRTVLAWVMQYLKATFPDLTTARLQSAWTNRAFYARMGFYRPVRTSHAMVYSFADSLLPVPSVAFLALRRKNNGPIKMRLALQRSPDAEYQRIDAAPGLARFWKPPRDTPTTGTVWHIVALARDCTVLGRATMCRRAVVAYDVPIAAQARFARVPRTYLMDFVLWWCVVLDYAEITWAALPMPHDVVRALEARGFTARNKTYIDADAPAYGWKK